MLAKTRWGPEYRGDLLKLRGESWRGGRGSNSNFPSWLSSPKESLPKGSKAIRPPLRPPPPPPPNLVPWPLTTAIFISALFSSVERPFRWLLMVSKAVRSASALPLHRLKSGAFTTRIPYPPYARLLVLLSLINYFHSQFDMWQFLPLVLYLSSSEGAIVERGTNTFSNYINAV